eukprot:Colp12_sorted_trinity150504_noHs@13863
MVAYHSIYNDDAAEGKFRNIGNLALLPLNSTFKGPAPRGEPDKEDIVDEALAYFKANVFFKNFEIKGNPDRVLIYLTLYITECLQKLQTCPNKIEAGKAMATLALANFDIPGDSGFPMNAVYQTPANRAEADQMRQYLTQLRQELGQRLVERVFKDNKPDKWWMCFVKRNFLNKSLTDKNLK